MRYESQQYMSLHAWFISTGTLSSNLTDYQVALRRISTWQVIEGQLVALDFVMYYKISKIITKARFKTIQHRVQHSPIIFSTMLVTYSCLGQSDAFSSPPLNGSPASSPVRNCQSILFFGLHQKVCMVACYELKGRKHLGYLCRGIQAYLI